MFKSNEAYITFILIPIYLYDTKRQIDCDKNHFIRTEFTYARIAFYKYSFMLESHIYIIYIFYIAEGDRAVIKYVRVV